MDHCLLYGGDVDGNVKLFTEVLGFTLVERVKLEDSKTDLGVWLTCSAKAHDIALCAAETASCTTCRSKCPAGKACCAPLTS